jgi:hypothetical protein
MTTDIDPPIVSEYDLLPQITLRTTVWVSRCMVTVTILDGPEQLWAGLLAPADPTARVPIAITAGEATLEPGTTFTLTAGPGCTEGSVSARGIVRSGGGAEPVHAVVATWGENA